VYLLDLELAGERVQGATDRESFSSAQAGDTVRVRYQRRRFTGRTQVVSLSRR
jgi:hypothetical protein